MGCLLPVETGLRVLWLGEVQSDSGGVLQQVLDERDVHEGDGGTFTSQ